ncbi:MAG: peptide chain release factor N(5)-glutamine methyltransferase [Nocardioidaceae bacterium]
MSQLVMEGVARLQEAGVASPRNDAELLLSWALDRPRSELHGRADGVAVDEAAAERFRAGVGRRAQREPLQHIVGTAPFRYLDLHVGPGVFIPRPETELMAGLAVEELGLVAAGGRHPIAVDLCSGSGAVAIAMATEQPASRVIAVEITAEAHGYAERNAAGLDIDVRLGDMVHAVDDLTGLVDVVTANPPYIPVGEYESVEPEARDFDPPAALWSGAEGLDAIRAVERVAARLLRDGGLVACEHSDHQGEQVIEVFASIGGWAEIRDHRDLAGRSRFVAARRIRPERGGLAR